MTPRRGMKTCFVFLCALTSASIYAVRRAVDLFHSSCAMLLFCLHEVRPLLLYFVSQRRLHGATLKEKRIPTRGVRTKAASPSQIQTNKYQSSATLSGQLNMCGVAKPHMGALNSLGQGTNFLVVTANKILLLHQKVT